MKLLLQAAERDRAAEIAAKFRQEGYEIQAEPLSGSIPFELGGYRPDLILHKGGHHYLVEVKTAGVQSPIEQFRTVAEEVRRHPGWHFLLVTGDDVVPGSPEPLPGIDKSLTRAELEEQVRRAERLLESGDTDAAFLLTWAAFEGLLRLRAEEISLPVERFPSSALLKHFFSQGELSIPQYDCAVEMLALRNRVAHGFPVPNLASATPQLLTLVKELLTEWKSQTAAHE